jgi:hypothetical protein
VKRSVIVCMLLVTFLSFGDARAAEPEPVSLLVSSVFADSSVVAPVAWYRHTGPDGSGYRVGISGWTIEGQWTERRSPVQSLLLAAELTPMNAHNSNRVYENGEHSEELDYDNASYRIGGGVRLHAGENTHFDILVVGLYESVSGLPAKVVRRWERPYAGLDVQYTFRDVSNAQPLIAQIDGIELSVRGEGFLGEDNWSRITVSQQWGTTLGRFHLRQGSAAVFGTADDFVNQSLIGGSWDALGGNAVYGLRQGELRTGEALMGHFGADVRVAGTWYVGGRMSLLVAEDLIQGYALNVSGTWRTFGFSGGVALAESTGDRTTTPQVYAALIIPLHRRPARPAALVRQASFR